MTLPSLLPNESTLIKLPLDASTFVVGQCHSCLSNIEFPKKYCLQQRLDGSLLLQVEVVPEKRFLSKRSQNGLCSDTSPSKSERHSKLTSSNSTHDSPARPPAPVSVLDDLPTHLLLDDSHASPAAALSPVSVPNEESGARLSQLNQPRHSLARSPLTCSQFDEPEISQVYSLASERIESATGLLPATTATDLPAYLPSDELERLPTHSSANEVNELSRENNEPSARLLLDNLKYSKAFVVSDSDEGEDVVSVETADEHESVASASAKDEDEDAEAAPLSKEEDDRVAQAKDESEGGKGGAQPQKADEGDEGTVQPQKADEGVEDAASVDESDDSDAFVNDEVSRCYF